MLTIKQITDDKEGVIKGLEKKHFAGAREAIDAVLRQNDLRRETQGKLDTLLQAMNAKSKEIGALMREGKREEAEAAKAEVAAKKDIQITLKRSLTDREQMVFDYFLNNVGKTVYAKDLASLLDLPRDYIYKYIKNLRAKIEGDNLKNVPSGGFMLTE